MCAGARAVSQQKARPRRAQAGVVSGTADVRSGADYRSRPWGGAVFLSGLSSACLGPKSRDEAGKYELDSTQAEHV